MLDHPLGSRHLLLKSVQISVLALLSLMVFCSTSYANVSLQHGAPRGGLSEEGGFYSFTNLPAEMVSVFAADSDELAKEILSTSEDSFSVLLAGSPGGLTLQPHSFDAGDWAHAIAVFENDVPVFFLQMRRAGSTAEVLDSSLASAAVSANLWTSTDEYFEFNPGHAIVFPVAQMQSGPASFGSAILPEPSTIAMLCLAACCFPTRLKRYV